MKKNVEKWIDIYNGEIDKKQKKKIDKTISKSPG